MTVNGERMMFGLPGEWLHAVPANAAIEQLERDALKPCGYSLDDFVVSPISIARGMSSGR